MFEDLGGSFAEFTTGSSVGIGLCGEIGLDPPADQFPPFPTIEDILFPPGFTPDPRF